MAGGKKVVAKPEAGQKRVVITHVEPEIDAGRFPAKRVVGELVTVEADIFGDGHDHVEARLLVRGPKGSQTSREQPAAGESAARQTAKPERSGEKGDWTTIPLTPIGNDRWRATFPVASEGIYQFTLAASIDHLDTWQDGLAKKFKAGQDVALELKTGSLLLEDIAGRLRSKDAKSLVTAARQLRKEGDRLAELEAAGTAATDREALTTYARSPELLALAARYPHTELETRYDRILEVAVDRERARFSTWYELFPRSQGADASTHGTLRDVEAKLPYLKELGFDVLYMPPIHPIGREFRKGKNNSVTAEPGDVGSPWAIGSAEGGHLSILPELGTLREFEHLREAAAAQGIELALDIAFQCAPDHPWVQQHPSWFKHRADGSIQYAENPPKKYQDIYPIDFESEDWSALWDALAEVFLYWAEQGVRIFRVDNPHTKAFPFWQWCIAEVKRQYPDALFLAEAFTRPRVMEQLAKVGFSQSYTYFCWRTTKAELTEYLTELTRTEQYEYFRPNFWPNTPDILPFNLQTGGQGSFALRLVLAATMNPSYGIYGGAYESLVDTPFRAGGEEYFDSEKYEIKHWPLSLENPIAQLLATLNRARREHAALQTFDTSLRFHTADNPQLIAYSKRSRDNSDIVLTVVNLDPVNRQTGWLYLDTAQLGLTDQSPYTCEDLLSGAEYRWIGPSNYVALDPAVQPAHVFVIRAVAGA